MKRSLALAGLGLAACAAAVLPLQAQGSGVDQQSACMSGRIGAGVGAPCDDGSAVYFNPAGLAAHGSVVGVGVHLVRTGNVFRFHQGVGPRPASVEREEELIPVPQAFVSYRLSPRLAVGIGGFAPYGLGLEWPVCPADETNCAGPNFEGRYSGYDNALRGIYIQPTVAFQVIPDRFLVGAGVDVVRGSIEVHQRADAPQLGLQGVDIADATLEGSGWGVTGHVAAMLRVSPRTWLGARYLHSARVDLDGDATFRQIMLGIPSADAQIGAQFVEGGPLGNQGVTTDIEFPFQLVVGISHRLLDRLNLLFDYQRTGWSSFDAFELDFENATADDRVIALGYDDTNTFRFAAEYDWTSTVALRAGFRYNTAATPRATPLLPEGERNIYTVGVGFRPTGRLSADLAFQHIVQPDRAGAVRPGGPDAGIYESTGQVFGFTLAYRFGGTR